MKFGFIKTPNTRLAKENFFTFDFRVRVCFLLHTDAHFLMKNNRLKECCYSAHSYRLAPKYHFPNHFEDVYNSLKWFLHQNVLDKYGVDPERIGISGDSAGGNLVAAVTQQVRCLDLLLLKKYFTLKYLFQTLTYQSNYVMLIC